MRPDSIVSHFSREQRIFAGVGAVALVAEELRRLRSSRPIIIGNNSVVRDEAIAGLLDEASGHKIVGTFSGVTPHCSVHSVVRAARFIEEHDADLVIAVGGGSAIVTARAAAIIAAESAAEGEIHSLATRRGTDGRLASPKLLAPKLPQIVIPTTPTTAAPKAGSAIVDEQRKKRLALFDPKARAKAVILDPRLLDTAPDTLIVSASLNALSMALEGLATGKADPVAAAMLSAALRTCALALGKPDAGKEPSARIKLAWAAVMCGLGTDSAGGALASALGHASGTIAGTTNGLVNAIVLPEALRFNREAIGMTIPEIAHALDAGSATAGLDQIIDILRSIFHGLDVPARLRELSLPRELLPRIAAEAMDDWSLVTNPRPVAEIASLQEVLEAVW